MAAAFQQARVLIDECESPASAVEALAREGRPQIERIRLTDAQLVALRTAFEALDEEHQRQFGPRLGQNVELRGFSYDHRRQSHDIWVAPTDAYLPKTIDRETQSFAVAAAETPGLRWLATDYARVLRREGGRRELGAQRFLVRLGAATAPRLIRPTNEASSWARDTRKASAIVGVDRPDLQLREIRALAGWPRSHLLKDRWSPDLDAVISSISADRKATNRKRRGLALLAVLARAWDRVYAEYQQAHAVYGYNGYWVKDEPVIATWLARAAGWAWLPAANGKALAPIDLYLPTEANRIAHGDQKASFLAPLDAQLLHSAALTGLRVRRGPSASALIAKLQELASEPGPVTPEVEAQAHQVYRLLAMYCSAEGGQRPIDDVSLSELRSAFEGESGRPGLVLANRRWRAPGEVLAGPPIFGRHRVFAPNAAAFDPLWRTLDIRPPDAAECLAVLRELSRAPLGPEDAPVVIESLRALSRHLRTLSVQQRAALKRLPLWTSRGWQRGRPVFAFESDALTQQASSQVAVWLHGLGSFTGLEGVVEALGVTVLRQSDFSPVALRGSGLIEGDQCRRQFALAVEHLRTELARGDDQLHGSIEATWDALRAANVIVEPDLRLRAVRDGETIELPTDAYLLRAPLSLLVRSIDDAGTAEAGGEAIASLFAGDRQKVAWAWAVMWQRAGQGITAQPLVLSTERRIEVEETNKLLLLKGQAASRARRKGTDTHATARNGTQSSVQAEVRKLKDLSELQPDDGEIVNRGVSKRGIVFPPQRASGEGQRGTVTVGAHSNDNKDDGGRARRRAVLPPVSEREQLAYEAVQKALRLDPPAIADLRARRGIGADAMDELRQFYEIKMASGDMPDEITLSQQEAEAATRSDFFLAIVSGLEEGRGDLRVRFIFNPLERLSVRIRGDVTLTGLREVEALEYRFPSSGGD